GGGALAVPAGIRARGRRGRAPAREPPRVRRRHRPLRASHPRSGAGQAPDAAGGPPARRGALPALRRHPGGGPLRRARHDLLPRGADRRPSAEGPPPLTSSEVARARSSRAFIPKGKRGGAPRARSVAALDPGPRQSLRAVWDHLEAGDAVAAEPDQVGNVHVDLGAAAPAPGMRTHEDEVLVLVGRGDDLLGYRHEDLEALEVGADPATHLV